MATPGKALPQFKRREPAVAQQPATEAAYLASSAEDRSRGRQKTGRPAGPEPVKNIGISLPITLLAAIDQLAAEQCAHNRSFAITQVLRGKLKLPPEQIS